METNDNNNLRLPSDFQPPLTLSSQHVIGEPSSSTFQPTTLIVNPRISTKKKRSKFIRIDTTGVVTNKPTRKPDPSAPEITRPCTECGRKFWSWKALFGHMRCHPERRWRGINPPPNFRRTAETNIPDERDYFSSSSSFTEEDHEVAACLLMLAHTPTAAAASPPPDNHQQWASVNLQVITPEYSDSAGQNMVDLNCGRFECASCKKVFGSHQALGGHRASHKNVKGCYAITKNICTAGGHHHHHHHQEQEQQEQGWCSEETATTTMLIKDNNNNCGHKCSICFRVFSSGQALGGHMRCHWEKDEPPSSSSARVFSGFDLNLAAAPPPPPPPLPVSVPVDIHQDDDDDDASSSSPYCTNMALDLRLGL